jgi:putative selenium metabolism hydrolase
LNTGRLINFTQNLIQRRSLSGEEKEVVHCVINEMKTLDFDRCWIDEVGNAVGIIEGSRPGPLMLLDAHCDTVPALAADWSHDPFGGEIVNGRLYGRGTADTKGNLAAMVYAAGLIDRSRLAGRVAVSATVNEEIMEGVSIKTVMNSVQPQYVVIGEATDLNLNRGGRGRTEVVIETIGQSAHSSSPEVGSCAVHEMMRLINSLEGQPLSFDPLLGPERMVLTDIISVPYPGHSVIPNRCRVTYDWRLLIGETAEMILNLVKEHADHCGVQVNAWIVSGEEKTYTNKVQKNIKFFPAWKMAETDSLVQAALTGLQRIGLKPELKAFQFCTNAAYSAGIAGVPTIGFGLATEKDAHTVDESISLSDLETVTQGYERIIYSVLN